MFSMAQALRFSLRLHRLSLNNVESYTDFALRFQDKNTGSHWTERQIRHAYDLWRRDILKEEVRAEFLKNNRSKLLTVYLKDRRRQINIATVVLLALAVLFPPYYLVTGGQTVSLGPGFAFSTQVGRVDSLFLLCVLTAIIGISWFAQRTFTVERSPDSEGSLGQ